MNYVILISEKYFFLTFWCERTSNLTSFICLFEVIVTLECFMCGVNPACIMKRVVPLYDFRYSFDRTQCCSLKMWGFDLCKMSQKTGKNSEPETAAFVWTPCRKKITVWSIWLITIQLHVMQIVPLRSVELLLWGEIVLGTYTGLELKVKEEKSYYNSKHKTVLSKHFQSYNVCCWRSCCWRLSWRRSIRWVSEGTCQENRISSDD